MLAIIVVVLLFARTLGRLVMLVGATNARADQPVMPGIVADNAADDRSPQTSGGLSRVRRREGQQRKRRDGNHDRYFLHNKPPDMSLKPGIPGLRCSTAIGRVKFSRGKQPISRSAYFQIGLPLPGRP
jgi:hypothetical protein